jgi:hypothetical protein
MSEKIKFMRDKDISIVNENVDAIIKKARNREIQIIEPVIDEFKKVRAVVLDYIKNEKRIIYGGFAWNMLIKKKTPDYNLNKCKFKLKHKLFCHKLKSSDYLHVECIRRHLY